MGLFVQKVKLYWLVKRNSFDNSLTFYNQTSFLSLWDWSELLLHFSLKKNNNKKPFHDFIIIYKFIIFLFFVLWIAQNKKLLYISMLKSD